jgi:ParB family transcriptional regulator, chromosome partitioning protein
MTDITSIPLNKLVAADENVRRTAASDAGIQELAASIATHGLLQSLVVRKHRKGKYAVIAGGRRLTALRLLAERGSIDAAFAVPCQIRDGGEAMELSLAENVLREPMHPADEFEAFRALVDGGMAEADVAARFGVTEAVVSRRLRLARVSPAVMDAYRGEQLSLAQVMAFCVSDDHAMQERVFANLSEWNDDPHSIRDALTESEIAATDRRVRFVGLSAYEKAGGGVRRDLFCEDDSGIFILDPALLDRLADEKLAAEAEAVRAEGWKWVEARPAFDYDEWSGFIRRHEETVPLSPGDEEKLDALCDEYNRMQDAHPDPDEETEARLNDLSDEIDALRDRETFWPPETLAVAGAVVCIDDDGEIDVRRGLVSPAAAAAADDVGDDGDADDDDAVDDGGGLPYGLVESLTTHRTAALGAALSVNARMGLVAVVHALALKAFYSHRGDSCIEIFSKQVSLKLAEGSAARSLLETATEIWREHLPGTANDLFAWCLEQTESRLLDLLAQCAALSLNAVQGKTDRPDGGRFAHAHALAQALDLDMTAWFTPTAGNFFGRLTKTGIVDALREVKGNAIAPAWLKAKKADLAAIAEREVAGTGWLPGPLRRAA